MQLKLILFIVAFCTSTATYAAASGSLWGEVDEPLQDPETAVKEQMAAEAALEEPAAPAVPEKTICDVLIEQPRLDLTTLNSTDILTKLRTSIDAMPDEYKALVSTNESMGKLYQEYRAKYLKTYCTK